MGRLHFRVYNVNQERRRSLIGQFVWAHPQLAGCCRSRPYSQNETTSALRRTNEANDRARHKVITLEREVPRGIKVVFGREPRFELADDATVIARAGTQTNCGGIAEIRVWIDCRDAAGIGLCLAARSVGLSSLLAPPEEPVSERAPSIRTATGSAHPASQNAASVHLARDGLVHCERKPYRATRRISRPKMRSRCSGS